MRRIINRLKNAKPSEIAKAMRPTKISQLLYELSDQDQSGQRLSDLQLDCQRFHQGSPSGVGEIDRRIGPDREVYTAWTEADGSRQLVHHSTLFFDALLPAQFGFAADVPVIGGCWTEPAFRGHRIYPHMLSFIAEDFFRREQVGRIYVLVSPENVASIKGIEHAGFRRIGELSAWRVGGFLFGKRCEDQSARKKSDENS